MTAAASVAFPPSRTLAAWWPELRSWHPAALWIRHLTLLRVEALVRATSGVALDDIGRFVLEAVAHRHPLRVNDQFLQRWLGELAEHGLIHHDASAWHLTPTGEGVLRGEKVLPTVTERRTFYFALPHEGPPQFLPLHQPPTSPLNLSGNVSFDVANLTAWVGRADEVKQRAGFPLDVLEFVAGIANGSLEDRWQQVVVAHAEQLSLLMVLTNTEAGEQVRGFAFQPGTWQLHLQQPVLTLGPGWREQQPELAVEPSAEQWRQAWCGWGQPRSLPAGDLEACALERDGPLLRVRAPGRLIEELRKASSDALKGETWLMTGNGSTRSLALVELIEQS